LISLQQNVVNFLYIFLPGWGLDEIWSSNLCSERFNVCFYSVQVKGFATPADVDEWLAANPMRCTGALHFHLGNSNSTLQRLGYGIQTNSTSKRKRGQYEDHTLKFQIPLQVAAEREIARYLLGGKSSIPLCFFGVSGNLFLSIWIHN
jgi:hypothetical protein